MLVVNPGQLRPFKFAIDSRVVAPKFAGYNDGDTDPPRLSRRRDHCLLIPLLASFGSRITRGGKASVANPAASANLINFAKTYVQRSTVRVTPSSPCDQTVTRSRPVPLSARLPLRTLSLSQSQPSSECGSDWSNLERYLLGLPGWKWVIRAERPRLLKPAVPGPDHFNPMFSPNYKAEAGQNALDRQT